jgi:hypothetical protein
LAATAKVTKPSVRRDPAPRRVDRTIGQFAIKGADPTKSYVWAYKVGDAVGYYENLGYEVVLHAEDGPHAITARKRSTKPGEPVESFGQLLMSIDKTELAEMEAERQAEVDQMEARIISKGGGVDSLRGIHGVRGRDGSPVLGFENKTTAPVTELE